MFTTHARYARPPRTPRTHTHTQPTAAKLWKEKSTLRDNYANLGITAVTNSDAAVATVVHTTNAVVQGKRTSKLALQTGQLQIAGSGFALRQEEETHVSGDRDELLADMTERAQAAEARTFMFEGDQEFVERLERKHQRDFKAMARDMKLNPYQHTPAQLKAKFHKYEKLMSLGISKNRSGATELPCHTYNMGPGKQKSR